MRLSVHVTYTEADIARLIRDDLERRNLQVVVGDIKFRMTKAANRYQFLGAEIEASKPVEALPMLVERVG